MNLKKLIYHFLTTSLFLAGLSACSEKPVPKPQEVWEGRLLVSDTVTLAGQNLRVQAIVEGASSPESCYLIWSGNFGDQVFKSSLQENKLSVTIPDSLLRESGRALLSLCVDGQTLDQRSMQVLAGTPQGIIETYTGPRTIVVNSRQTAMTIGIPKDTFGNPANEGTAVQFQLRYPGRPPRSNEQAVSNLVSSLLIEPDKQKGKILVGAKSGEARSIEETIDLTPAWPIPFSIQAANWFPFADPRQNVFLQSGFITDAEGNKVADGTLIHFIVQENGTEVAHYRSFTSNGSVGVYIQNPEYPTDWEIFAYAEGEEKSNTLELTFASYIKELPFEYDPVEKALLLGPISGPLGQMVSDDFKVDIQLAGPDTTYFFSKKTKTGFCNLYLPFDFRPGVYQCQVLAGGKSINEEIEIK